MRRLTAILVTSAIVIASTSPARADWDLRAEPADRVSLPADEAERLFSDRAWYRDMASTGTTAASSWRALAEARRDELDATKAALRDAQIEAQRAWYESPILWLAVGAVIGGGLVGVGAWSAGG